MPLSPRLLRPIAAQSLAFRPNVIAGLQLWLDAADSSTITVSTGVSEWRDKSTTGSAWTQTTGNSQPLTGAQTINGRNVIVFDGSNDWLESVAPLSTSMPLTFFIVQQIVTKTNFGMSYTSGVTDGFDIRQESTAGRLSIRTTSTQSYLDGASVDRTGIVDVVGMRFPTGLTVNNGRRNGVSLAFSASTTKPALTGTHSIGSRGGASFYANVRIGEIIAFNTLLSDADFILVQSYLMQKWGAKAV
jgi:hypothetical protein